MDTGLKTDEAARVNEGPQPRNISIYLYIHAVKYKERERKPSHVFWWDQGPDQGDMNSLYRKTRGDL